MGNTQSKNSMCIEYKIRAELIVNDLIKIKDNKNDFAIYNAINLFSREKDSFLNKSVVRLFPKNSFDGFSDKDLFIFSTFVCHGRLLSGRSKDSSMKDFLDDLYYESGSQQEFINILKDILSSGYIVNIKDEDIPVFVKEYKSNSKEIPFSLILEIVSPMLKNSKIYPIDERFIDKNFSNGFPVVCELLSDVKY